MALLGSAMLGGGSGARRQERAERPRRYEEHACSAHVVTSILPVIRSRRKCLCAHCAAQVHQRNSRRWHGMQIVVSSRTDMREESSLLVSCALK